MLRQDSFILQIEQGLDIPFLETPVQASLYPGMPYKPNATLINHEVQEMALNTGLKEVSTCSDQRLSLIVLVAKKDGRGRVWEAGRGGGRGGEAEASYQSKESEPECGIPTL